MIEAKIENKVSDPLTGSCKKGMQRQMGTDSEIKVSKEFQSWALKTNRFMFEHMHERTKELMKKIDR